MEDWVRRAARLRDSRNAQATRSITSRCWFSIITYLPTFLEADMPPRHEHIPLTGAAAMEDLRRQREMEQAKQQHYMTLSNPSAHTRAAMRRQRYHAPDPALNPASDASEMSHRKILSDLVLLVLYLGNVDVFQQTQCITLKHIVIA